MNEAIRDARILLVDDQPSNLAVLFETLDQFNCTVLVAQSGEAGLDLAMQERPDIILLDILMPRMDGYEVCERLKADTATRDIPVIFVSALTDEVDMVKAFGLGAVDYISKPIRREEVLARVGAHLTIRRQHDRLLRFFSIIAHDLRAPFHALLGGTALLLEDPDMDAAMRSEIAGSLHGSAQTAYELTENLLEWGRLQQDAVVDRLTSLPLEPIAASALEIVTLQAAEKQQTLETRIDPGLHVLADRQMMESVLRNLLSNAVKFTPKGGTIRLSAVQLGEEVEIIVEDSGVGIPEEALGSLFRLDVKYQREGTDAEKGTGLGLLVSKEMLDLQNASVWAESEPGSGTQFHIRMRSA